MAKPDSLRERRKQRTREDITRAAVELFQDHGYEATSVDDIVERAGCGRSTFFRYFRSKEDVLFGSANARLLALRRRLAMSHPSAHPWDEVKEAMAVAFFEFLDMDAELEAACIALWFTEPAPRRRYLDITMQFETAIAEFLAIERGVDPETDLYSQTVATMIIGAIRSALRTQISADVPPVKAAEQAFSLLENGLRGPATQGFAALIITPSHGA